MTAAFFAIAITDLATGADVTLRALYLLPISAAAWWVGRGFAIALAVVSVVVALFVDIHEHVTRLRPTFVYSDAVVRLIVYVAATLVIRALREAQARLAELAQSDPLTSLNNRRGFERLAKIELQRAVRLGTSLTMTVIDLDGFKTVNDTRGHREGDRILAAVGVVLAHARSSDIAARLGGDEFALLLTHPREEDANASAAHVLDRLRAAMDSGGWSIRFSAGAVTYVLPPTSVDEMVAAADALMYDAKRDGGDGLRHVIVETAQDARDAPTR